ncbi:MAG: hypothetical protein EOS25_11165 [Mesorhizobium sp.]|nr:MAG: hypothetical protein EOS59_21740 [Mesorhizobium sp.]RWE51996.1 MAG: hypothetical protein EOS24_31435 [Mesorhizobium sp.]RWF07114.1 MAG: hypothetical protein EOS69_30080 [Mesorhizobium sp.]RWF19386.1 MAG: hypothetical protein EOS25_11165 [Mesorhizobium sp.]TIY06564.1 MAG: hypothetical protein E5V22_02735 [Mesorhizobium sp.]
MKARAAHRSTTKRRCFHAPALHGGFAAWVYTRDLSRRCGSLVGWRRPGTPTKLAPLRNPAFRSIWTATQVSSLGWFVQTVAISG